MTQLAELAELADLADLAALVALAGTAVVFGTGVFCALVLRPALAQVDDATLTAVTGNIHRFGDRRMPVPGVLGLLGAAAASVLAGSAGDATASISAGVAGDHAHLAAALPPRRRSHQPLADSRRRCTSDRRERPRPAAWLGPHHPPPRDPSRPCSARPGRQPYRLTLIRLQAATPVR